MKAQVTFITSIGILMLQFNQILAFVFFIISVPRPKSKIGGIEEDYYDYYDDYGEPRDVLKIVESPPLRPSTRRPKHRQPTTEHYHGDDIDQNHIHKVPPRLHELESKLMTEEYDGYHANAWEYGRPVVIGVGLHIQNFAQFRKDNTFNADLSLRKIYFDKRLTHHSKRHIILNEPHLIKKIWKPDLYIANAQETSINAVTKPHQLLKVHSNGKIEHSIRIAAKINCHLSLHAYPVDSQVCSIRLLSFAHPQEELQLHWKPYEPLTVNPEIMLPEMHINGYENINCKETYENETFSCLEVLIHMERKITSHLLQTYLPSIIIVMISWVSFWIDPNAVPARITLSFTTLLTLTTQAAGLRVSAPPVAYAKALDYWMGMCTIMVLLALLEYTLVNSYLQRAHNAVLRQKQKKVRKRWEQIRQNLITQDTASTCSGSLNGTMILRRERSELSDRPLSMHVEREFVTKAYKVDTYSRFIFPSTFLIINIIYWSYLLSS